MSKALTLILTGFLQMLVSMACLYVGWNDGVMPLIVNGLHSVDFWPTFYLSLFFMGVLSPVTIAIHNQNTLLEKKL